MGHTGAELVHSCGSWETTRPEKSPKWSEPSATHSLLSGFPSHHDHGITKIKNRRRMDGLPLFERV
jgi:hypothetical protein